MPAILVVLNPHSRKNRGRDRAHQLGALLGDLGQVVVTRSTDELPDILERALAGGDLRCLVSDGGDGALHWALNAAWPLCEARGEALPLSLPTNGGTIDFVARKAGVHGDAMPLLAALVRAERSGGGIPSVELDSLELELERPDGARERRLGFALAAGGIGQRFFGEYYADPTPNARTIVAVITRTVGSLAAGVLPGALGQRLGARARRMFAPAKARVTIDGERVPGDRHGGIHAGAFDVNLGGVIKVFPLARADGVIHFQAGEIRALEIVANLPALATGGAIRSAGLRDTAGDVMEIEAIDEPLDPVLDGELCGPTRRMVVRRGPRVRIARISAT